MIIDFKNIEQNVMSQFKGGNGDTVAANCPNCGGAMGYGQAQCSYCGSRVAHVLKNTWTITKIEES